MKKLSLIIAAVFVFGVANTVNAKKDEGGAGGDNNNTTHEVSLSIDEITLLDIENGSGDAASGFSFVINPSDLVDEAGAAFNSTVNLTDSEESEAYLQYTALVSSSKYIEAKITSGSLPEGFNLNVKAGNATGGKGTVGKEKGYQALDSENGVEIISNIGTCYTGTGSTNGHKLDYQLEISDEANISKLTSGAFDITVTYTITE